jgi:hypothetical protein
MASVGIARRLKSVLIRLWFQPLGFGYYLVSTCS